MADKKQYSVSQIQNVKAIEKLEKVYDELISIEAIFDEKDDEKNRVLAYEAMEKIGQIIYNKKAEK
jgi:hypothetical protein